jgi:arylsulfatase A-like enzyme
MMTLKNKKQLGITLPILAVGGVAISLSVFDANKQNTKHPNIILIVTDDHSYNAISCYGSKLIQTPNIDRIANEGMRFDNFYVSNSISGPSRACILTGKMSHINGFTDNSKTFNGNQMTFPKLLHVNGYQTAMIGKWHLTSDPQGFDFWSVLVGQGEYYNPDFKENGKEIRQTGYVTDIITDKAINYLKNRDIKKPFALIYNHKAPHRPWIPAQRHLGIYNNKTFPEPDNLFDNFAGMGRAAKEQQMQISTDMWEDQDLKIANPADLEGNYEIKGYQENKADVSRANQRGNGLTQLRADYSRMTTSEKAKFNEAYKQRNEEFRERKMTGKELTSWKYQQYMRDYMATVLSIDENIGRLMKYLEDIGELNNTIIIYTSDQGFYLGEHGWFDKRFMYEESQRTPFLVRYPKGIKAHTVSKALTMNIDITPTLLDFAGLRIPEEIQGRSLKPVLELDGIAPADWREAVYYHYYEYPGWHSVKRHYGIRTNRYKLIHFYNDINEWELYDLKGDVSEKKNVYNDPRYKLVREYMNRLLQKTTKEYKDEDPNEKVIKF